MISKRCKMVSYGDTVLSHACRADVISAVSRGWDDCGVVPEVAERGGGQGGGGGAAALGMG